MGALANILKSNLLIVSIFGGIVLAVIWPGPGLALGSLGVTAPLIAMIFLCQGMDLNPAGLVMGRRLLKALGWGLLVSQLLGPLVGFGLGRLLPWSESNRIGFVLMCCMAPTLVSGAVLAIRAGGDGAAALLAAVALNLLGVVTVPYNLSLFLGADVALDAAALVRKLLLIVMAPAVLGHLLRRWRPGWAAASGSWLKNVPVILFGLVIYVGFSPQAGRLGGLQASDVLLLVAAAILGHGLLLATAYGGGRWVFHLGEGYCRSISILTSQKTIAIAIPVWSLAFASSHPLAILPPLIFHPTQILFDGLIASRLARRPARD